MSVKNRFAVVVPAVVLLALAGASAARGALNVNLIQNPRPRGRRRQ